MAITDAQQAKQIMMKKGGPVHRHQLAKKRKDGKRPGYYGPDMGHENDPGTDFGKGTYDGGGSDIDFGGAPGGSDQDFARARAAVEARNKAAKEAEEKKRKEEKKKKDIKTEKKIQKTKKAKTKKVKDFLDLADLENEAFGDLTKSEVEFDDADTNKDGKVGPIERFNAFTNRKNKEFAAKRSFDKFQDIEQYVSPIDDYGLTGKEMAEKRGYTFDGDKVTGYDKDKATSYGYDFSDLDKGLATLTSNKGTSIEKTRPNLYDVNPKGTYSAIQALLNSTRPDTQVTAMNTLNKAADYGILAGKDKVTQDDLRELRNRGRTDEQIRIMEGGGGGNDNSYIPPIIVEKKEEVEEEEDPFQLGLAFRADGGRVGLMEGGMPYEGGIMDLESGRQMYFLGKLVKKATRAVKKIVKSPVGKIGLGALMFGGLGGFSGISSGFGGFAKKFGFDAIKKKIAGAGIGKLAGLSIGGGLLAGALAGKGYEDEDGDGFDDNTGFSVEEYRQKGAKGDVPIAFRADGGMSDVENDPQYKGWKRVFEINPEAAEMHPKHREFVKYYRGTERQAKEEGGLMNLKGMEMDFREEGGFVPIGKKERADDVPARLSKNEFVMTADAVRGAGDGNIDKGAEKMYNLMSKLEAENDQPQGLDGARKMFQTSQRLEEVL